MLELSGHRQVLLGRVIRAKSNFPYEEAKVAVDHINDTSDKCRDAIQLSLEHPLSRSAGRVGEVAGRPHNAPTGNEQNLPVPIATSTADHSEVDARRYLNGVSNHRVPLRRNCHYAPTSCMSWL